MFRLLLPLALAAGCAPQPAPILAGGEDGNNAPLVVSEPLPPLKEVRRLDNGQYVITFRSFEPGVRP